MLCMHCTIQLFEEVGTNEHLSPYITVYCNLISKFNLAL